MVLAWGPLAGPTTHTRTSLPKVRATAHLFVAQPVPPSLPRLLRRLSLSPDLLPLTLPSSTAHSIMILSWLAIIRASRPVRGRAGQGRGEGRHRGTGAFELARVRRLLPPCVVKVWGRILRSARALLCFCLRATAGRKCKRFIPFRGVWGFLAPHSVGNRSSVDVRASVWFLAIPVLVAEEYRRTGAEPCASSV